MKLSFIITSTLAAAAFASAADLSEGIRLYEAKNYTQAQEVFRAVIQDEPENSQALYYLGMSLLGSGNGSEALDNLKKAADLAPDSDRIQVGLARAYIDQKDYDNAAAALDKARQANPDNPELPYYAGLVDLHDKKYEEAAKNLEQAIERDPNNAYAHYYAALAYNGLKQPDQVTSHFQIFLKMAPKAPEAAKVRSFLKATR